MEVEGDDDDEDSNDSMDDVSGFSSFVFIFLVEEEFGGFARG